MRIIQVIINEKGQVGIDKFDNFEGENNATKLLFNIPESWKTLNKYLDAIYTNQSGIEQKIQFPPLTEVNGEIAFLVPQVLTFSAKVGFQFLAKNIAGDMIQNSDVFNLLFKKSILADPSSVPEMEDIINFLVSTVDSLDRTIDNTIQDIFDKDLAINTKVDNYIESNDAALAAEALARQQADETLYEDVTQGIANAKQQVKDEIVGSAPAAFDTLQEIAAIFQNDPNLVATILNTLATKVDKITGKGLSTNDLTNELKAAYDSAVTNNHTHSNKAVLDAITDLVKAGYDTAASQTHTHTDLATLNALTAIWKLAVDDVVSRVAAKWYGTDINLNQIGLTHLTTALQQLIGSNNNITNYADAVTLESFVENSVNKLRIKDVVDYAKTNATNTFTGKQNINDGVDIQKTSNQRAVNGVNSVQNATLLQSDTTSIGGNESMTNLHHAFKFVASGAHTVGSISVKLKKDAGVTNTTDTVTIRLYSDNAGTPNISLGTFNSIRIGNITTSYVEYLFGYDITLTNGNTYWIDVTRSAAITGTGSIYIQSNGTAFTTSNITTPAYGDWVVNSGIGYYNVYGQSPIAVRGTSTNSTGVYGISTNFTGVHGISTNSIGVYGNSTNYIGVYGISTNSTGVYGASTNSIGVSGNSTSYFGVYGNSTNSYGVYGASTNSYGVYGASTNSIGVSVRQEGALTQNNTSATLHVRRSVSGAFNTSGNLIDVNDTESNSGSKSGHILQGTIGGVNRLELRRDGVCANSTGTWTSISDERVKENIKEIANPFAKIKAIAACTRHFNFINQNENVKGTRTGYIAQLLENNGLGGHVSESIPKSEADGALLGWEYETITDENGEEKRVVKKQGEMQKEIEVNFTPYLFPAVSKLIDENNELKQRLTDLENLIKNITNGTN